MPSKNGVRNTHAGNEIDAKILLEAVGLPFEGDFQWTSWVPRRADPHHKLTGLLLPFLHLFLHYLVPGVVAANIGDRTSVEI